MDIAATPNPEGSKGIRLNPARHLGHSTTMSSAYLTIFVQGIVFSHHKSSG